MHRAKCTPTTLIAIGDDNFILQPRATATVAPFEGPDRFIPATTICCNTQFGDAELKAVCVKFSQEDDVWTDEFLEVLILQCLQPAAPLTLPDSIENGAVRLLKQDQSVPNGPYVIHSSSGRVYSLLKLFPDHSNAFVRGAAPEDGTARYRWLHTSDHIPVPSKLYYDRPNENLPLSGLRFGVKDAIDVAGLETGSGSSCYRSLYPVKESSAPFVSQLVSAGAVMVGKMRLCQFCDGQDALERLEEITPTNPRGDGFQKPSASSSGSAAGAASYPWLDFTIGSDTGGSVRHPAGVNGLYGLRPSLDSIESSGLVCSALLDTPGIFSRSAVVLKATSEAMTKPTVVNQHAKRNKVRFKLMYAVESDTFGPSETPKFFSPRGGGPEANTPAGIILETFVRKLEDHLGCQRDEVCLYDLWKATRPSNTPESLIEATGTIYQDVLYYELAHTAIQPFVQEYQAANSKMPFIEPVTKARIEYGARVSESDYNKSVEALKTYATWVNETLLPSPSLSTSSSSDVDVIPLLIYPQSWGRPQYRDETAKRENGKVFWSGFSAYSISYCSGCPDVTVPIGEVKFRSKFTETDEFLPVALSVLAPRGMDEVFVDLLAELEERGVLKPVECGPRLWPHEQEL